MGRTKVRASGHVAGPASVRLTRRITSTCQSPPLPRAAGSDCARNGSNRTKVFAAFAAAHASPFGRLTRWRGARAGHHLRDIVGGPVAELVGIEGGVVSGVINLESSGVEAPDRRPRHEEHYHEA